MITVLTEIFLAIFLKIDFGIDFLAQAGSV
jgi:hypothetical protein